MNDLLRERERLLIGLALAGNLSKAQIDPLKLEILPQTEALTALPLPSGSMPTIEEYILLGPGSRVFLSILVTLHYHGIKEVEVRYSGSGDSGDVDSVDISAWANETEMDRDPKTVLGKEVLTPFGGLLQVSTYAGYQPTSLDQALRGFVETEATERGCNWYNNEGGGGTAIFDVGEMELRFEHYCNFEEYQLLPHKAVSFAALDPEIQDYLTALSASHPEHELFEIAYGSENGLEFRPFNSTIDTEPPGIFSELAEENVDEDGSWQIAFNFVPGKDAIVVDELILVESTHDEAFEIRLDPETFSI